ncbi:uncharacterized protein [Arachis hypogaea]|uniref:uncharacterized protein n=1 Tax=Arachis hypogaea TaxID=3818 RepID=UPI003B2237E0
MVNFLAETTHSDSDVPIWELHMDGASNVQYGVAGLILTKGEDLVIEASIKFDFSISNNQAEYEALFERLTLALDVGATKMTVFSDSQFVTFQVNGEYQAWDPLLEQYLKKSIRGGAHKIHYDETRCSNPLFIHGQHVDEPDL